MARFDQVVQLTDSWSIDEVAYSLARRELRVKFPSTRTIWLYQDVPPEVFAALLQADSAGEYFNRHIRNAFRAERTGAYRNA